MLTREEKKELRIAYWKQFKTYSNKLKLKAGKSGKWIMNDTGIRQLKLKFHFDEIHAFAGIEIDTRNLDKRIELFDKLEKLKSILEEKVSEPLTWELESPLTDKRTLSRIYAIKEEVNIYNKQCWREVNNFLYSVMNPIEDVFIEFKDYLKYNA